MVIRMTWWSEPLILRLHHRYARIFSGRTSRLRKAIGFAKDVAQGRLMPRATIQEFASLAGFDE